MTDVATEQVSTVNTVTPRIIKPNLKAIVNKTPYSLGLDNMMTEFCSSYFSENMSEEDKQNTLNELNDTINMIRALCDKHLQPLCSDNSGQKMMGGAVAAAAVATPVTGKPLSEWQIFLKYAKECVPNYTGSTDRMGLCKAHYAAMTADDRAALRARYEAEHPNAPTAATAAAAKQQGTSDGKVKRRTGFSDFSKDWYAAFKAANPGASGLQSTLCSQAWKELTEAEREQWKLAAKQ